MSVFTIRSGHETADRHDYVRYSAARRSYEVTTRRDPGLATAFQIDESRDARGRTLWRIAAVETARAGAPGAAEAELYMTWAHRPLMLIAPPDRYPRLGGVGDGLFPPDAALWVAHATAGAGGTHHCLESVLSPGYFLAHMFERWEPLLDGPLGLRTRGAEARERDFWWIVEPATSSAPAVPGQDGALPAARSVT